MISLTLKKLHIALISAAACMFDASAIDIISTDIDGYVGNRIDACINHRVKGQSIDHLIEPFRNQNETQERWQTEFWGKWVQGAIGSYRYDPDPELYSMIEKSVEMLLQTQLPDGYIGNYDTDRQLTGWDVWGRKYVTLGLLKWYDLSGDRKALDAACRLIDYTITQIGPGAVPVYMTGMYKGMASGSILEPVVLLYNATGEKRYLDFAMHLVRQLDEPGGPQLLTKADVPVADRFPVDENHWWTPDNGQKAYEMMSCYVGMLELYKITHEQIYLDVVEKVVRHIMDEELNVCGAAAASECWYNGRVRQTVPSFDSMETCVTFTWIQINERLLQITGKPVYADNIETTAFNALMASMRADGSDIAKYIPLEGFRHGARGQCDMEIHCCNANGPRGFALIPSFALTTAGKALVVNTFVPSSARVAVGKDTVDVSVKSNYPVDGKVEICITGKRPVNIPVKIRIPAWSNKTSVKLNDMEVSGTVSGSYLMVNHKWKPGDVVSVDLDMSPRLVELNHQQAIVRGPIVLARDSRFNDGFVDEVCDIPSENGKVNLIEVDAPEGIWQAYKITVPIGTYPHDEATFATIHLCDFASAGNLWDSNTRYRVWLPKPVNVTKFPR